MIAVDKEIDGPSRLFSLGFERLLNAGFDALF
jgi:hypothetical protein